jgi:DNA-binding IclR family transcriptional regulator
MRKSRARRVRTSRVPPVFSEFAGDKQFATTLARGLEILRCFTPEAPTLGNKDLASKTGLPKPTISRFTYTLSRLGYLRADRISSKYQLGAAVLSIGYPVLATNALRQVARSAMRELADYAGGSVSAAPSRRANSPTSACRSRSPRPRLAAPTWRRSRPPSAKPCSTKFA